MIATVASSSEYFALFSPPGIGRRFFNQVGSSFLDVGRPSVFQRSLERRVDNTTVSSLSIKRVSVTELQIKSLVLDKGAPKCLPNQGARAKGSLSGARCDLKSSSARMSLCCKQAS
jgi:hypothetical protein